MLALAATVSLGAFALSSSTASAFHPVGPVSGVHVVGGGGLHVYNKPIVLGIKIPPPKVTGIIIKPPHVWNHNHWWWRYTWRRPYFVAPVIVGGGVAAAATYAAAPSTNRCTCLTKEYTPQGAVVFKDVCTNEMAMNPPADTAPAASNLAPQMPQQQGYLQPQPVQAQ
jgi:hypothetical protein